MAKPDCDDGWLKYAHELDAALAVADFTKGARIVLREVFSQIFGPAKLKAAALSPTDIAGRAGSSRPHVARAIKELTDSNALLRDPDGSYRFNKDYSTWTRNGSPRLSPVETNYCRNAPALAFGFKPEPAPAAAAKPDNPSSKERNSSGNISTEQRNDSGNKDAEKRNDSGNTSNEARNSSGTESVPESLRFGSPPKNPLLGRRLKDSLGGRESLLVGGDEPFHVDPEPKPPTAPQPIGPNSVEDCERAFLAADELFPDHNLRALCRQWLTTNRAARVIGVMTDAKGRSVGRPSRYVQAVLDNPEPSRRSSRPPEKAAPPPVFHVAGKDSPFHKFRRGGGGNP